MADIKWLREYVQQEILRLQKIALGYQEKISKHEELISKHAQILDGGMFVGERWQHTNGIMKSQDAILNLKVMFSEVSKKIANLNEAAKELETL